MDLQEQYAKDALNFPVPWAFWERKPAYSTEWMPCKTPPSFNPSVEFRRINWPHCDPYKAKKREPYSRQEIQLIKKYWPDPVIYEKIPNRTKESIDRKAKSL